MLVSLIWLGLAVLTFYFSQATFANQYRLNRWSKSNRERYRNIELILSSFFALFAPAAFVPITLWWFLDGCPFLGEE